MTETPERYQPADPSNADETVAQLTDAGPENARTIIPEAQAEALVYRDLLDHTRQQSADALGVSKSTVDDRLRRGRDNVQGVAATARVLLDLGLLDHDDLALEPTETDDRDEAESESVEEPEPEAETPTGWAAIMAIDAVTKVTRASDGTAATVQTDGATTEERQDIKHALNDVGLAAYGTETYGDSGRVKLRARPLDVDGDEKPSESAETSAQTDADTEADEPDEADHDAESAPTEAEVRAARADPDAHTCHYCGDAFTIEDDDPDLLASWNHDAEHPACSSCLADVAMGDETDPLPEFRDRDEQGDADDLAKIVGSLDLPGSGADLTARRESVIAAYQHLASEGTASRKDFLECVYPQHNVGYSSGASWWSSVASDALHELAERRDDVSAPENPRAGDKWTYDGE